MINSISGGSTFMPPKAEQSLTQEQQRLITETLSKFDADNLSESDALSIVETFSEAGINPNKVLATSMSDLGFDAKNIGDLAQQNATNNRPPPPPPEQKLEKITSMVEYLDELLKEKLAENNSQLTDEDKQLILSKVFEKYGVGEGDSLISTKA